MSIKIKSFIINIKECVIVFDKTDVDYIIYLLKRKKEEETDNYQIFNHSANYILNQLLRQIKIPDKNWYISYKASILWKKITTDDIENYKYQSKVTMTNSERLEVITFKGNSNNKIPKPLEKGGSFAYREVFHDEHIIPINVIIKELDKLTSPTYESVVDIISKIHICRILKSEDRDIHNIILVVLKSFYFTK